MAPADDVGGGDADYGVGVELHGAVLGVFSAQRGYDLLVFGAFVEEVAPSATSDNALPARPPTSLRTNGEMDGAVEENVPEYLKNWWYNR